MSNDPSVKGETFLNVQVKQEVQNQDKILIKEEPKEEEEVSNCNIHTFDKATQKNFVSIYFSYFSNSLAVYVTKDAYAIYLFFGQNLTATRSGFMARASFKHTLPEDIKSILIEINLRKAKWLLSASCHPPPPPPHYKIIHISSIK